MSFNKGNFVHIPGKDLEKQAGGTVGERLAEPVIRLDKLGKCYQIYNKPRERLLQMFFRGRHKYYREFWALHDVSLEVNQGDVVGVIGRNGAGKSTLLQLVCGTLNPSSGEIFVRGRVAALLELGAGFNPEFTGRENAFLSAAVMGLTRDEIEDRLEDIIEFSGIRDFIDQPVKTYSSGMYVRLAFSVATSVDPDILVVDEALAVGDGDFARKSFDRIMIMKDSGKTILFCSHALYQIEALCGKAIWLSAGKAEMIGDPATVVMAYNDHLNNSAKATQPDSASAPIWADKPDFTSSVKVHKGTARIVAVKVMVDSSEGKELEVESGQSDVTVRIKFAADQSLPMPHVALCFVHRDDRIVTSAGTHFDNYSPQREVDGGGEVTVVFPRFALLRGEYRIDVYLLCERGVHVYERVCMAAKLFVTQSNLELGVVTLPHSWSG